MANLNSKKIESILVEVIKDAIPRLNEDELFEVQAEIYLQLEKFKQEATTRDTGPKHPPPPPTTGGG